MERIRRSAARAGALAALLLAAACSEGGEPTGSEQSTQAKDGGGATELTAAQRGERVYENVCIACHNADPSLAAAVGPAVAGSSYELLEARVIHGRYPEGYTPKGGGGAMPVFPWLKDSIGDLEAYLAQAAEPS